jgi:ubiquinone/menaquinone biosynthesis C-methylase UbiE
LDLGCGDGNYTEHATARDARLVGLDRSPEMLAAARRRLGERSGVAWVQGDVAMLPFADHSFVTVIAVTVLCFAADRQRVIDEAFRVLRPGGRLVLGELGRYSSWALTRRLRGLVVASVYRHAHFFSLGELHRLLGRAGFGSIEHRGAVLYPPLYHTRLRSTWRRLEESRQFLGPWAGAFLVVTGVRPA